MPKFFDELLGDQKIHGVVIHHEHLGSFDDAPFTILVFACDNPLRSAPRKFLQYRSRRLLKNGQADWKLVK